MAKPAQDHWLVAMNRRNRSVCFVLLGGAVASHLQVRGYGASAWVALVLVFLVYPQAAYIWARRHADGRRAELVNIRVDTFVFGAWAAGLHFPLWISFILLIGATLNPTAFWGWRGLLRAAGPLAAGLTVGFALGGVGAVPDTDLRTAALCMATTVTFVLIVAQEAYQRSRKLDRARKALRLQLESIGALQAQLREQAERDPLTGMYNRRYLDVALPEALRRCAAAGSPLSIAMIDVDHFKRINDAHGHPMGDQVLRALATILTKHVRDSDIVCRFGGEEFLVVLPGMRRDGAMARAEAWRSAFEAERVPSGGEAIAATLSVGIATFPEDGDAIVTLVRAADDALYRAKRTGRNRVCAHEGG